MLDDLKLDFEDGALKVENVEKLVDVGLSFASRGSTRGFAEVEVKVNATLLLLRMHQPQPSQGS